MAEPARAVDVANFCHYFRPRHGAHNADDKQRADKAMDQLKSLFGDEALSDVQVGDSLADDTDKIHDDEKARFDALFKKD